MLSIALCTYNGEKYIAEQLQSIVQQTYLPDELVIADDCSSDRTIAIIEKIINKAPFTVRLIKHSKNNGVIKNFFTAISACTGDYIALCDQDDVWCSDKLSKCMQFIKKENLAQDFPFLLHTDLYVTDKNLKITALSMMRSQHIKDEPRRDKALKTLLMQNYVTGCTVIFNKALKQYIYPLDENIIMHDWWLALLAAVYGKIIFIDEPLVYYRQHSKNEIGAGRYFSWRNIKKLAAKNTMNSKIANIIGQINLLAVNTRQHRQENIIVKKCIKYVQQGNIYGLVRLGVGKQGYWKNFFFYIFLFYYGKNFKI